MEWCRAVDRGRPTEEAARRADGWRAPRSGALDGGALIYKHASREADRSIADHMDAAFGLDAESPDDDNDGEAGALVSAG